MLYKKYSSLVRGSKLKYFIQLFLHKPVWAFASNALTRYILPKLLRPTFYFLFLKSLNLKLLVTFPNSHFIDSRTLAMLSLKAFCYCLRYAPLDGACKYYLKGYTGSLYIQGLSCWCPKENFSRLDMKPGNLSIISHHFSTSRFPSNGRYKFSIIQFRVAIDWYFRICWLWWPL